LLSLGLYYIVFGCYFCYAVFSGYRYWVLSGTARQYLNHVLKGKGKMNIRKAFTVYLLALSAIGALIIWGLMLVDKASASTPLLQCQEGFTWFKTDWGETCILNTPAPTLEMYPGPEDYPTPVPPCLDPYPGPECGILGQAVNSDILQQDNPKPTMVIVFNPFEGIPDPRKTR
jgi:hypothetical protein